MNLTAPTDEMLVNVQPMDELMQWELRIAQRADQLAARAEDGRKHDLVYWLQAEREVLTQFETALPEFVSA